MRIFGGVTIAVLAITMAGCLHEPNAPSVAVVDLDLVARELGKMEEIDKQLKAKGDELRGQLQQAAAQMQAAVNESQAVLEAAGDPTNEQKAKHQKLVSDAAIRLEQLRREANQAAGEERRKLIIAFREQAKPAVDKVARLRRTSVVLTATANIVWVDKSVDITSAVLAELRQSQQ